jgi:predicted glycosyltransferase
VSTGLWLDLANSPQVLFFRPLIAYWKAQGHTVTITSRPYAQTIELCDRLGLDHTPIGVHGGRDLWRIGGALLRRAQALRQWARARPFGLAVSHNSYGQLMAARSLGLRASTTMDYEFQSANHLAFRLAHRIVVPETFPERALRRFGAGKRVRRYHGIKEQLYLADFTPDPGFRSTLGVNDDSILVVLRPAADWALYHRFENPIAGALLDRLLAEPNVTVLFLPRVPSQGDAARALHRPNLHVPDHALDGPQLLAAADAVFSAGGTMAREAAVLGTPAYSLFAGARPAVDELLVREGRLSILRTRDDIERLTVARKTRRGDLLARTGDLVHEVADLLVDFPV